MKLHLERVVPKFIRQVDPIKEAALFRKVVDEERDSLRLADIGAVADGTSNP